VYDAPPPTVVVVDDVVALVTVVVVGNVVVDVDVEPGGGAPPPPPPPPPPHAAITVATTISITSTHGPLFRKVIPILLASDSLTFPCLLCLVAWVCLRLRASSAARSARTV
jgi:hypothetical protein